MVIKLAKIGYVRVREEHHLTISHKTKTSFSVTVQWLVITKFHSGHSNISFLIRSTKILNQEFLHRHDGMEFSNGTYCLFDVPVVKVEQQ